jgi:Mn-dependent DtxR family transcriptional regulator
MGCKKKECSALSNEQLEVLKALVNNPEPCGSKEIAAAMNLEGKQVNSQLTDLKKKGFVASPVRCKYTITDQGRNVLQ